MSRIFALLLPSIALTGCVSSHPLQIDQDDSFSKRVELEKSFTDRISLIGKFSHYKVKEQIELVEIDEPSSSADLMEVVVTDDNYFAGPREVDLNLGVMQTSLELKLYPVKYDWAQVFLGVGLNYMDLDLKASSEDKVSKSPDSLLDFKTTLGVYFPMGKHFGASISAETLYENLLLDAYGEHYSLTAHWVLSRAVQVEFGYFHSRLSLDSQLDVFSGLASSSCGRMFQFGGCRDTLEPGLGTEGSGIEAGLTFRF